MVMPRIGVPDVLALVTPKYYRGAVGLMLKDVRVGLDLLAPAISIATLELDLCQEVPRDPVHLVKLRVRSAEWAVIRVLRKPVSFAVGANGFLADLALEWVLEYIVAHAADQLRQERGHIRLVIYVVLLIHIA